MDWVPYVGKSRGVLCGVRRDTLDVVSCSKCKYVLQMVLFDKKKKFQWGLLVFYGSAHDEFKNEFLIELATSCSGVSVPYIVGETLIF